MYRYLYEISMNKNGCHISPNSVATKRASESAPRIPPPLPKFPLTFSDPLPLNICPLQTIYINLTSRIVEDEHCMCATNNVYIQSGCMHQTEHLHRELQVAMVVHVLRLQFDLALYTSSVKKLSYSSWIDQAMVYVLYIFCPVLVVDTSSLLCMRWNNSMGRGCGSCCRTETKDKKIQIKTQMARIL